MRQIQSTLCAASLLSAAVTMAGAQARPTVNQPGRAIPLTGVRSDNALPADSALVGIVQRLARDPHKAVRAAAARALLKMARTDPVLGALAHDPDREVRRAAAEATPGVPVANDENWLHVYVTDDEREPMRHALYVLTRPDGLVKAGYTDLRGELGEERIPPGTADLDLISSTDPAERAP